MFNDRYSVSKRSLVQRGYSLSGDAINEQGDKLWVKWILGIRKDSVESRIISDRLRHIQQANHPLLPAILDYGYDQDQDAYAIVYEYLDAQTFKESLPGMSPEAVLDLLSNVADCLNLLAKEKDIVHGDLNPENILVGADGRVHIIDFSLSDLTGSLSQGKDLEVFSRAYAAPEKFKKSGRAPRFLSDVYSFGRIAEEALKACFTSVPEIAREDLSLMMEEEPADRPRWVEVKEMIKRWSHNLTGKTVKVLISSEFGLSANDLNTICPCFYADKKYPGWYYMFHCGEIYDAQWDPNKKWLRIPKKYSGSDKDAVLRLSRKAKSLPQTLDFSDDVEIGYDASRAFQQIAQEQLAANKSRTASSKKLDDYFSLVNKELEVIEKNALELEFRKSERVGSDIYLHISLPASENREGVIAKHINENNDFNAPYVTYDVMGDTGSREALSISGKPFDLEPEQWEEEDGRKHFVFKIKDCELSGGGHLPSHGTIHENTQQKQIEKRRQRDALSNASILNVQNPNLIRTLLNPTELKGRSIDYDLIDLDIQQKDAAGTPFVYSTNQRRAIINALEREPLSIIQGPPGTGKTTVITEIVFQILERKPESRILVTSQTNNAVDQVLENLIKNNIPVVRLVADNRTLQNKTVAGNTIENKLAGWKESVRKNATQAFKKRLDEFTGILSERQRSIFACLFEKNGRALEWNQSKTLLDKFFNNIPDDRTQAIGAIDSALGTNFAGFLKVSQIHFDWLKDIASLDEKSPIATKLINSVRVIGATCNHIAAKKYDSYSFEFDYVIMDESGKATVSESLVPINLGHNLVFVGDHRQLKPTLTANEEVRQWLKAEKGKGQIFEDEDDENIEFPSLFEDVIRAVDQDFKVQLTECRRMSEEQTKLTSKCFYESEGDEPIEFVPRPKEKEHAFKGIDGSILFVDIGSNIKNSQESGNRSSFNMATIDAVKEVLLWLNQDEASQKYSFGVITGYKAQYNRLRRSLNEIQRQLTNICRPLPDMPQDEKFSVSLFDRYQGLERDVMIVDLVKSGPGCSMGFQDIPNRMNVALSRQKKLLIIVGDRQNFLSAKSNRVSGNAAIQNYIESIPKGQVIGIDFIKEENAFFKKAAAKKPQQTEVVHEVNKEVVTPQTDSVPSPSEQGNRKFAAVELSSKAVKFLYLRPDVLPPDYNFKTFMRTTNKAAMIAACKGMSGSIDLGRYSTVTGVISEFMKEARSYGVKDFYAVATGVYRNIDNAEQVLANIKSSTGLDVKVISEEEELQYCLNGHLFMSKVRDTQGKYLFVSQGASDVIISYMMDGKVTYKHNLKVGSIDRKEQLRKYGDSADARLSLEKLRNVTYGFTLAMLQQFAVPDEKCPMIVSGSTMRYLAKPNGSSKDVHGRILTKVIIEEKLASMMQKTSDCSTVGDLFLKAAKDELFESALSSILCEPVIEAIMDYVGTDSFTLSGTSVWEGLFAEHLNNKD